jgi:hypothetical protein
MGTHPSKVQGKWEHKYTQPKGKTKANNQRKNKIQVKTWCKKDSWLQNDNQW